MFKFFKNIKKNIDTFITASIGGEEGEDDGQGHTVQQYQGKKLKQYELSDIFPFKVHTLEQSEPVAAYCRKGSIDTETFLNLNSKNKDDEVTPGEVALE